MRYIVGFTPSGHGQSVINLAAMLAKKRGIVLDIVVVLPRIAGDYEVSDPKDAETAELAARGREWLAVAKAALPKGVQANGRIYYAESVAHGLVEAATDPSLGAPAELIVVGPTSNSMRGRFTVGGVAAALLHSSPVPVALVPADYAIREGIGRVTAVIGTRQGAEPLLDVAMESARGRQLPLRLVSLAGLGVAEFVETKASLGRAKKYVEQLVARARKELPPECTVISIMGKSRNVEDTFKSLGYQDDEVVLMGSSRLTSSNSRFMGAAAHKLMRVLPVPIIVVPRDYRVPSRQTNVLAWMVDGAS